MSRYYTEEPVYMFLIMLDVKDLERALEYRGIPPDTLEATISLYLTKSFGLATTFRPNYPARTPLIPFDFLDRYFEAVDFIKVIAPYIDMLRSEHILVDVTIDRGYLTIKG